MRVRLQPQEPANGGRIKPEVLVEEFQQLVTSEDLEQIFGVTRQTIFRWRQNEGLDKLAIVFPAKPNDLIRFQLTSVLRWASRREKATPTPGLVKWRRRRDAAA